MTEKKSNQGFTVIVNSPGNIVASGSENITMNNTFFGTDVSGIRHWERAEVVEPVGITAMPTVAEAQADEETPCRRRAADPSLLSPYIDNVALCSRYARRLSLCGTARELGVVVCDMIFDEDVFLHREEAVKRKFIDGTLREYAVGLTSGTSIYNIRYYIRAAVGDRELEEKRKLKLHAR